MKTDNPQNYDMSSKKRQHPIEEIFKKLLGYDIANFKNLNNFAEWLHQPMDCAALGVFRMLFGAAMLIDIAEERGGGQLDLRFGEPQHCHFPLFDSIQATSFPHIGLIYLCMWLGAIGITLGYHFRLSCFAFIVPYWYIFLLDKPSWNNHSYLFGLCGSLLLFTNAHFYCSLDSYFNHALEVNVPYWNYFLIKFQFFILYMYAGLKKLTSEWLSGYAMSSLGNHWLFTPFRTVLSVEMIDLLIVHWFTALFDFSIAFFMTCEKTRLLATPFMITFHLMNSRLFVIGMFPWVCLAEITLFYEFDWPRKLTIYLRKNRLLKSFNEKRNNTNTKKCTVSDNQEILQSLCSGHELSTPASTSNGYHKASHKNQSLRAIFRSLLILFYCCVQLFLPYSHFITKGYNNWTNGLYGYSWDMMVHTYDTVWSSIKIVDNTNGNIHYMDPYAFTEYDRWMKYADMALQYAKCIEANILDDFSKKPSAIPLSSKNFSIYFEIWCSMNGRFQQRVFDPRVDILKANWSLFERTSWSLPLLNELNHMRPKLKIISEDVLSWSNYTDVVFVTDFPGLTLDNYISPDLINVTLTILEGNVLYSSDDEPEESYFITAGRSFTINSGVVHHVTTIGQRHSCYFYTYANRTMLLTNQTVDDNKDVRDPKPILPIWKEFKARLVNYKKFLNHLRNCVLFIVYGVPIPITLRQRG